MERTWRRLGGKLTDICAFIGEVYGHDLHGKRVDALAGATLGNMTRATLASARVW